MDIVVRVVIGVSILFAARIFWTNARNCADKWAAAGLIGCAAILALNILGVL